MNIFHGMYFDFLFFEIGDITDTRNTLTKRIEEIDKYGLTVGVCLVNVLKVTYYIGSLFKFYRK